MSLKKHGDLMKGMKEQKSESVFFVSVKEPDDVKRNLLESLKDIIENLHSFERFKSVRSEKLKTIAKLRDDVRDLVKLNSRLKSALPETKLRIIEKAKKEKKTHKGKKKPSAKKEIKIERAKPMTELERLESELSAIEGRLGSLR